MNINWLIYLNIKWINEEVKLLDDMLAATIRYNATWLVIPDQVDQHFYCIGGFGVSDFLLLLPVQPVTRAVQCFPTGTTRGFGWRSGRGTAAATRSTSAPSDAFPSQIRFWTNPLQVRHIWLLALNSLCRLEIFLRQHSQLLSIWYDMTRCTNSYVGLVLREKLRMPTPNQCKDQILILIFLVSIRFRHFMASLWDLLNTDERFVTLQPLFKAQEHFRICLPSRRCCHLTFNIPFMFNL